MLSGYPASSFTELAARRFSAQLRFSLAKNDGLQRCQARSNRSKHDGGQFGGANSTQPKWLDWVDESDDESNAASGDCPSAAIQLPIDVCL